MMILLHGMGGATRAGLISSWDFEADDVIDMWAGNDGMLRGNSVFTDGRPGAGRALVLGGSNYVEVDQQEHFAVLGHISVAAWVKVRTFSRDAQTVISKGRSWAIQRKGEQNALAFTCLGLETEAAPPAASADGAKDVNDGQWHHVVGVYDGQRLSLYVDGVLDGSVAATGRVAVTAAPVWIGANAQVEWKNFEGWIDDVAIFDHALGAPDVERLRAEGVRGLTAKGRMEQLVEETEKGMATRSPAEATASIEKAIAASVDWQVKQWRDIPFRDAHLSPDLYCLLAQVKERAKAPEPEIIATYEDAFAYVPYPTKHVAEALVWLSQHAAEDRYKELIKKWARNSRVLSYDVQQATKTFAAAGKWEEFVRFLDALFAAVDLKNRPTYSYARAVLTGLPGQDAWRPRFTEYCRSHAGFAEYTFRDEEERARKCLEKKEHRAAAQIYEEIAAACKNTRDKATYEFRKCECLFSAQQYALALPELDKFIAAYEAHDAILVSRALMLKARSQIGRGQMDAAMATLFRLMIDYPETELATEANFSLGYYHMLQGEFPSAASAFALLMTEHPNSSYAQRSRVYLERIKGMTQKTGAK